MRRKRQNSIQATFGSNMSTHEQLIASPDSQQHWLAHLWSSTVGKKLVMALTGAIGVGVCPGAYDWKLAGLCWRRKDQCVCCVLKSNSALLWTARSILIAAVVLHIVAAYQLARTSQKSRPIGYRRWRAIASDFASRTMRWTGPLVGIFIVYHLLHLTTGAVHPDFSERNVYHNVISGFQVWYVSTIYIVAMLALLTVVVVGGFISIPVAVLLGLIPGDQ